MNLDKRIVKLETRWIRSCHALCSMGTREHSHGIQVILELFHQICCLTDGARHVLQTGRQLCIEPVLGLSSTRATHGGRVSPDKLPTAVWGE